MKKSIFRFGLGVVLSVTFIGSVGFSGSGAAVSAAIKNDDHLSPALRRELARVRAATAKYHDISNAEHDGYININVFVPGQGFHYLKPSATDANFNLEEPELLVYAANPCDNNLQLVAVEYAVPTDLAATPPEGFTGDDDVWDRNDTFMLWTLHAWVWLDNPNGIFADINPRVP